MTKHFIIVVAVATSVLKDVLGYETLHIINLQNILCPEGQGFDDIFLDISQLSGDAAHTPHIVTFFRSSNLPTEVGFQLLQTDARGDLVATHIAGNVNLVGLNPRKLGLNGSALTHNESGAEVYLPSEDELDERRLSARRRYYSIGNYGAPLFSRRRGYNTLVWGRRRRYYAPFAPGSPYSHRRFITIGGNGYGYISDYHFQNYYGGYYPIVSPIYGYAGISPYGPGRLSIGYLGLGYLSGLATSAYINRVLRRHYCWGYDCCYGCINSCYNSYRSVCRVEPSENLWRDDILQSGSGFYPSDYMAPLRLRITFVRGVGYSPDTVCSSDRRAATPDLFVTLTRMSELADQRSRLGAEAGDDGAPRRVEVAAAALRTNSVMVLLALLVLKI
jgi:hypothetical protein